MEYALLVESYATPTNVRFGVAALLFAAGVSHVVPGSMQKKQTEDLGISAWFLVAAGLLMVASGVVYATSPAVIGTIAVGLCMGGSFATAAMMPKPIVMRGFSACFSVATLVTAIWAHVQLGAKLDLLLVLAAKLAFMLGLLGRVYCAQNAFLAGKLSFLAPAEVKKADAKKEAKQDIPAEDVKIADKTVQKAPSSPMKKAETEEGAANRRQARADSPKPKARTPE